MHIDFTQTAATIITDLFQDLERAIGERKNPFRFCYLATTEVDNVPAQRMVVFRGFLPSREMLVFTDYRSPKLQEIKLQNQVSLLFYHPERQVQLRIKAEATIHHQDTICLTEWKKLSEYNKKHYQTDLSPGSDILNPEEELTYNSEFGSNFFSILALKPIKVDVLQLSRMGHKRVVAHFENGEWVGNRVMP